VDHVHHQQQRDPVPVRRQVHVLQLLRLARVLERENASHHPVQFLRGQRLALRPGDLRVRADELSGVALDQLACFFLEGHPRQQRLQSVVRHMLPFLYWGLYSTVSW
jgi:hypothetical protein